MIVDYKQEDILPEIRRHVKNCPDVTLLYAVARAQRIFCRESWFLERTIALQLVNGLDVYELNLMDPNLECIQVRSVQYNQFPLISTRMDDIWISKPGNTPFQFGFEPPDLLYLRPIPTNVQNTGLDGGPSVCTVRMVCSVKESQDFVPAEIYQNYKDAIAAGAISWCLCMPGEVWTNNQLSQAFNAVFVNGVNEAKRRRQFGGVSRTTRAHPRSWLIG